MEEPTILEEEGVGMVNKMPGRLGMQVRSLLHKGYRVHHLTRAFKILCNNDDSFVKNLLLEGQRRSAVSFLKDVAGVYGKNLAVKLVYFVGNKKFSHLVADKAKAGIKDVVELLAESGVTLKVVDRKVEVWDAEGYFTFRDDFYHSGLRYLFKPLFTLGKQISLFLNPLERNPNSILEDLLLSIRSLVVTIG